MNILFFDICRLLIDPKGKWAHAFRQSLSWRQVFRHHIVPLLLLYAVCSVAGGLLFSSRLSSSVALIVTETVVQMAAFAGTLFLTAYILNETGPNFGLPYKYDTAFMLIAYSWTPVFIVSAFIGLFPFMEAFKILYLYAAYILWTAMPHVPSLPARNRLSYALTAAVVSWLLCVMIHTLGLRIGHSIL